MRKLALLPLLFDFNPANTRRLREEVTSRRNLVSVGVAGITATALMLSGCEEPVDAKSKRWTDAAAPSGAPVPLRWYRPEQVARGEVLYQIHCAECHGESAEGMDNWQVAEPDSTPRPPPLDGTGHTWRHPLAVLRQSIEAGTESDSEGASMPAFGVKLKNSEIDAILAWVQSHWSDDTYGFWRERDIRARRGE